jgi:tetratricopeptide (TPR) repeat protein
MDCLRQAGTLAETLGDQRRLGQICNAMSHHCWRRGDHDTAMAYAQRVLTAASGDAFQQARACGHLGTYCFSLGDYRRAIDVLRQSMTTLEGELRHARTGMMVASVRTRCWLANCLGELGEFAEGRAYAAEAVHIAEEAAHLSSAIFAQLRLGGCALRQGDLHNALPILERALAQGRATDIRAFIPGITASLGLAYALSERAAEALALLDQVVMSEDSAIGGRGTMISLGEAYLVAGRLEEAHTLAEHVLALARAHQERGHQAWALRFLGDIAAQREPPEAKQAEAHYR